MRQTNQARSILRDDERLVDLLTRVKRGVLSQEQIDIRKELVLLSDDPDLFQHLKSPLKEQAAGVLDWVREDLATLNTQLPAWA